MTLRGHDLNDLPRYPVRRGQVAWTLRHADLVIAVADSLRDAALRLGAPPERTVTVGNGVDTARFAPQDRPAARRELGIEEEGTVVLSVGHLVERKGFHHLVRAMPRVLAEHASARLEIVGAPGEGPTTVSPSGYAKGAGKGSWGDGSRASGGGSWPSDVPTKTSPMTLMARHASGLAST